MYKAIELTKEAKIEAVANCIIEWHTALANEMITPEQFKKITAGLFEELHELSAE